MKNPICPICKNEMTYDCINDIFICNTETKECETFTEKTYIIKEALINGKYGVKEN